MPLPTAVSRSPSPAHSMLSVLLRNDPLPLHFDPSLHPLTGERLVALHVCVEDVKAGIKPLGYMLPQVANDILALTINDQKPFQLVATDADTADKGNSEHATFALVLYPDFVNQGRLGMSRVFRELAEWWIQEGMCPNCIYYEDEQVSVYADPRSKHFIGKHKQYTSNEVMRIDRGLAPLLGVMMYGCHLMAYEGEGAKMKLWIQRRSRTRGRCPLKLDTTVSGGLPAGLTAVQGVYKECAEEAGWMPNFLQGRINQVGTITYLTDAIGIGLVPETDYTFDLKLDDNASDYQEPTVTDDEVDSFMLMTVDEVTDALHSDQFTNDGAIASVEFLIRHGIVNQRNEPYLTEVIKRCHRVAEVARRE